MSTINGANHHNVEDILASIRTTIADEARPMRPTFGQGFGVGSAVPIRRDLPVAEEASEFELPAIFKPNHANAQVNAKPNLFGRLSDALKSAPEPDRSRTVIRFEPANHAQSNVGRMIEPPVADPAPTSFSPRPVLQPVQQPAPPAEPVARVMPTFFDTRISRMGELSRPAPAEPIEPAPVQVAAPPPSQPPRLPEHVPTAHDAVEDVAAQLMRPILKQWLMENMPKIVEKALRSESGDDRQPQPPGEPRKTLR
jgi:cell pole-organizing protein PopZ